MLQSSVQLDAIDLPPEKKLNLTKRELFLHGGFNNTTPEESWNNRTKTLLLDVTEQLAWIFRKVLGRIFA